MNDFFHFLSDIFLSTIFTLIVIIDNIRVSIALGTINNILPYRKKIAIAFGISESLAIVCGYFIGRVFIDPLQPWINIIAPLIIGGIGVYSLLPNKIKKKSILDYRWLLYGLPFSLSIDNMLIGATIGIMDLDILIFVLSIGTIAFLTSIAGLRVGGTINKHLGNKSHLFNGIIFITVALSFFLIDL
jgi:putative Mn2+ efflux pump MntP